MSRASLRRCGRVFAALANQLAVNQGNPTIGFINPVLYPAYSINNLGMTHDIIGNASGNYPAVKGYAPPGRPWLAAGPGTRSRP